MPSLSKSPLLPCTHKMLFPAEGFCHSFDSEGCESGAAGKRLAALKQHLVYLPTLFARAYHS